MCKTRVGAAGRADAKGVVARPDRPRAEYQATGAQGRPLHFRAADLGRVQNSLVGLHVEDLADELRVQAQVEDVQELALQHQRALLDVRGIEPGRCERASGGEAAAPKKPLSKSELPACLRRPRRRDRIGWTALSRHPERGNPMKRRSSGRCFRRRGFLARGQLPGGNGRSGRSRSAHSAGRARAADQRPESLRSAARLALDPSHPGHGRPADDLFCPGAARRHEPRPANRYPHRPRSQAGTYRITLSAANALGRVERGLRLVVGDRLALTPPMGWNSWYIHYHRVSDALVREAADQMIATGMADYGYQYVNIDGCWQTKPAAKDPRPGRPGPRSFGTHPAQPPLSRHEGADRDYIHAKGLKAGIYTSPGPTDCGGYTGSYGHEAQDARTFADWGFDFLKYDWCSYKMEGGGSTWRRCSGRTARCGRNSASWTATWFSISASTAWATCGSGAARRAIPGGPPATWA